MERIFVRLDCRDVGKEWSPFFIDVVLDIGRFVVSGSPFCGWWGKPRSEEVEPFVAWAGPDGSYTLDFGEWAEDDRKSRYRKLTLPSGPVRKGALISFPDEDGDIVRLSVARVVNICDGAELD